MFKSQKPFIGTKHSIQISKSKVFESPHTKRYLNIQFHATSSNPNTTNSEADRAAQEQKKLNPFDEKKLSSARLFFYQTTNDVVTLPSRYGWLFRYSFEIKYGS